MWGSSFEADGNPGDGPALLMALSENAESPNVQFIISMKIATLGWY